MKLYHNGHAEGWQIPGKQDKGAARADVPSSPADLAAWLNARAVPAIAASSSSSEPAAELEDGDRPWILGEPTKDPPRVKPNDCKLIGAADFVPIGRVTELDLHFKRCPKCHGEGLHRTLEWMREADLGELAILAEKIREHVAELNGQIDERGEAN